MRSLETVKNSQTSKVDRKLYVGNLPTGITHSQLVDLLNTALITNKKNAYAGDPVLSAWISQDGHYAFVEFRSIEEANQGFWLNNYTILGQNLKVGRPKTYAGPQPASAIDRNTLMGGYTMPTISAFSSLTDINKQGPLKPVRVYASTSVLCLQGVLEGVEAREEAVSAIRGLAEDHGEVIEVHTPEEGRYATNVYIEFATIREAKMFASIVLKKSFNKKPVQVHFIVRERFKEREFGSSAQLALQINA